MKPDLSTAAAHFIESLEPLGRVLHDKSIYPVFQPLVHLAKTGVYAHEALIRGPRGTPLHTPDALLRAAAEENLRFEFEYAALVCILTQWGLLKASGRLFVNVSAGVLTQLMQTRGPGHMAELANTLGVLPRELVLEITEHERVADMDQLAEAVGALRGTGIGLALDDFGDGHSSLRLWSQLKPDIVKIDRYFIKDVSTQGDKLKTIQALQQIASIFGSELVAEGIETADDLRVLRDLGIDYGQGYFLGHPDRTPMAHVGPEVLRVMSERQVAVFPELSRAAVAGQIRNLSVTPAPTVSQDESNDEVARIFLANAELHALAVLEGDKPIGIINRAGFMNEYTKLYYREVWGRKPCALHTNLAPRIIEREHNIDELVGILTSQDQRYLSDGFIVTEHGRYIGLGTGDQLVRSVTETRIEAARHANPLTFLPGNIPISQHIERLLKKKVAFVACYADLNNFKPYNDYYGYWRGDEMIRLIARIAMEQCDSQRDFLGHVGGDDFILLFQSTDWLVRCERLVAEFNERAREMFDEEARKAGGIQAEDRHGVQRFFPCTTVSIGAVTINGSLYSRAEEIANLAALAKHDAKRTGLGIFRRET
ncbi:diguanylate phosphodiesterase [Rhodoferax lacus]|uniref:Diguanylate phosphodiesterase n=1 Tax=Rhodoferax lacus TaxID=2184758 RepID=A0A3E1R8R1_9BURK|nr:phosphodiesterase [Rhodoferax lacus]RFO95746.1 diguanylate phosphodiesterase [Rhodoferax lacus]